MSAIKNAIAAMKEVIMLADNVDQAGEMLNEMSQELRDQDRRLVRLETIVEIAKAQGAPGKLSKDYIRLGRAKQPAIRIDDGPRSIIVVPATQHVTGTTRVQFSGSQETCNANV